jgi:SAM-dependent methyltransferase
MSETETPAAGQDWSAEGYARDAGFVPALGAEVLALLAPRAGERILDLGCGDGVLTALIAEAGAEVAGLEPDPDMAAAARGRGLAVMSRTRMTPSARAYTTRSSRTRRSTGCASRDGAGQCPPGAEARRALRAEQGASATSRPW